MSQVYLTSRSSPSATAVTSVDLVAMPWPPIYAPYLALSTLSASTADAEPTRPVAEHHLYLDWYAALLDAMGEASEDMYAAVAESGAYSNVGDFIFATTLFPSTIDLCNEFSNHWSAPSVGAEELRELQQLAVTFVEQMASRLADVVPPAGLVGLSSTFTQTIPSLSLAKALAAVRPDIRFAIGGANMSPERAEVLLRNFSFMDFVIFGEGEASLVNLLNHMDAPEVPNPDLRGIGRRNRNGDIFVETSRPSIELDDWPVPDAKSYFAQMATTGVDLSVEPKLAYEIGRGCWWGEKRHCTFCGLNGETMAFRKREGEQLARSIEEDIDEHEILDIIFADNILHEDSIKSLFASLPVSWDLRMHLEVKADLSRDQLLEMRSHGVWHVQPGIESLARVPLQLMRKGVTPMQNIRFLRNAEELGITASWNILLGFPGETLEHYEEMLQQLRLLHHLQPPSSAAALAIVRYSPMFEQSEDFGIGVFRRRRRCALRTTDSRNRICLP